MSRFLKSFILLFVYSAFFFPPDISALNNRRIVTVVSPVRGKNMWQSPDSLANQVRIINGQKISATWLTVYSNLKDQAVLNELTALNGAQEVGLFLEVDEILASDSQVAYLYGVGDWARPDKLLLSGYTVAERKRMIDTAFSLYKKHFGKYPSSVGAWYIDTLSLDYMVKKYRIKSVMDCSDQYRTDKYGLWGKPWGVPFYPSYYNSLQPAKSEEEKNAVTIQWAPRDLVKGYGTGVEDSTYSVQANDYIGHHRLNINYFEKVAGDYLFSPNQITQLTVGLEVGQEGAEYGKELNKQISILKQLAKNGNLEFMTMEQFADNYHRYTPRDYFLATRDRPVGNTQSYWYGTENYRINLVKEGNHITVRDFRLYQDFLFPDVLERDNNPVLERYLPSCIDTVLTKNPLLISSTAKSVNFERKTDEVILTVTEISGKKNIIKMDPHGIVINDILITGSDDWKSNPVRKLVSEGTLNYIIHQDQFRYPSLVYSQIQGSRYLGLYLPPDLFAGFTGKFPFFSIKSLPFQVISRFKVLPKTDPVVSLFSNLVNGRKSCKMNL